MNHANQKGTKVSNAHRSPLSLLRAALSSRRAKGSGMFSGTRAPSTQGTSAPSLAAERSAAARRFVGLVSLALLALASLLLSAAPASAAVVTDRPELFSFDGSDTTAGKFAEPRKIAVDNSSGAVYVSEEGPSGQEPGHHAISKFNPDGTAANFSATGTSSLLGTPGGSFPTGQVYIAVDNSGGPNQGRLYVAVNSGRRLIAFAPDGSLLWELKELGFSITDIAVDSTGQPWVYGGGGVKQFDSSGASSIPTDSFPVSGTERAFDIDASDNFYVSVNSEVRKYVGGVLDSTVDAVFTPDLYVDQSVPTGNLFAVQGGVGSFKEFDSSGALVGSYGAGSLFNGQGIGYNPALDRVYVGDASTNDVHAFGPEATGTTPDPAIEVTTPIGPGTAEFHGTVNPQSVPNAYYFEWFNNTAPIGVVRTPLQILPEDSSVHAVSFKATNLLGNVNTKVRLVGVNTATGLRTASAFNEFKTPKAAQAPDVTIGEPSAITASSATIEGTVNPREDSARWGVQTSTDPACASGFSSRGLQYLPGGEVNTPLPVEFELKDLLPAQHYCAYIEANNSFNLFSAGTKSAVEEFTTAAIPPSGVETSFAAPRTDTTARINGLVNPEGEADFTYRFELSEDGVDWTVRPDLESTINSRNQVLVSDELTGLQPDTTYHYRLALAENEAGPAASLGEVRTFTTRTSAELILPERGIELVNNPDKGNQNVILPRPNISGTPIAPDGDKALWTVLAGAPGGHNGTQPIFLAERTAGGWQSRSLAPPADQQIGGGGFAYRIHAANPDFSRFIFDARKPAGLEDAPLATRLRLDAHQNQEILREYAWENLQEEPFQLDLTDDGAHVLAVDSESKQLEEIGTGAPEVISLMPDGTESECGIVSSLGASFVGGGREFVAAEPTRGAGLNWRPGYHMMDMADASLVYFQVKPNGDCGGKYGLYVRDRDAGQTTLIDTGSGEDVTFVRATPDGRLGYFTTVSQLDPADANESADVYRWDQATQEATCLTCAVENENGEPMPEAAVQTPVLVSDDFSHLYFESAEQLVPGRGIPGRSSVFVLSGGTVRYVTQSGFAASLGTHVLPREPKLSRDGNVLLFLSNEEPTADPVALGVSPLYLYDDRNATSTECLSCLRGGVTTHDLTGTGLGSTTHALSADGSTVAFRTAEALVPLDVNREADVYEWRNGVRRLVTDGVSEFPSFFAAPAVRAVDDDGSDIFFTVAQPGGLTGFEQDGLASLYTARVGGGFEPPAPEVHCVEDSCQGPLQAAPLRSTRSSGALRGIGNLGLRRCRGRTVRRGSRCVSKRALVRRACRKKRGAAKRRCVRRRMRRLNRIQRRQLRKARVQADPRRTR